MVMTEVTPDEKELVVPENTTGSSILQPARYGFDPAQVKAIKNTVARDCNDAELVMFLEVCGRYGLDPFAKQVYAAKMRGGLQIIVSRDGLLAHAHKQPDFLGMEGDVVRANDEFKVSFINSERRVEHSYAQANERGPVVGAWTIVSRDGHGQTYFYADLKEYGRDSEVWKKHTSAMILKVAETYALRKAYSISGIVGEEEMGGPKATGRTNLTSKPVEPEWGDDPELAAELRYLVEVLRTAEPENWRPAKVAALLAGLSDEERAKLQVEWSSKAEKLDPPPIDAEVVE